ncbi:hypothetical protein FEAC_19650 [Ferrimicrobium acidiphilum DSM 19497]|uniref:Uncharacterized protein n=1 Tax=Ferrimicrobium acidiphilum DSM 19497 TaxID=1121877 RepID=A0A0D8FSI8_9ACTN|nr:hypothetical protein FEAC_19650 [Ferrimicrobium acidiphilum DSM 19497]
MVKLRRDNDELIVVIGQRGMLQSCVWTTSKASSDPVWVRLLTG